MQLQEQVSKLKGARDRLLAQLDAQSADMERVSTDNHVLSQVLTCIHTQLCKG